MPIEKYFCAKVEVCMVYGVHRHDFDGKTIASASVHRCIVSLWASATDRQMSKSYTTRRGNCMYRNSIELQFNSLLRAIHLYFINEIVCAAWRCGPPYIGESIWFVYESRGVQRRIETAEHMCSVIQCQMIILASENQQRHTHTRTQREREKEPTRTNANSIEWVIEIIRTMDTVRASSFVLWDARVYNAYTLTLDSMQRFDGDPSHWMQFLSFSCYNERVSFDMVAMRFTHCSFHVCPCAVVPTQPRIYQFETYLLAQPFVSYETVELLTEFISINVTIRLSLSLTLCRSMWPVLLSHAQKGTKERETTLRLALLNRICYYCIDKSPLWQRRFTDKEEIHIFQFSNEFIARARSGIFSMCYRRRIWRHFSIDYYGTYSRCTRVSVA